MKIMKRSVLILLMGLFIVAFGVSNVYAQCAHPIELCVAIDGSISIVPPDFDLQKEGLAQAVEDSSIVPQDGSVTISVVQFATGAVVEVAATVIDSQTTADNVADQVRAISQSAGGTNFAAAIDACMGEFNDPSIKWTIDISTDGGWTTGPNPLFARDAAVAVGLDTLNALGVGPDVASSFLSQLVWLQPASPPFGDGFVILVNNFTDYAKAIREKIQFEICPEDCDNGLDDDVDGLIDKDDPDCWICGDGIVDPPEECDDGNTDDGDGCSSICELENQSPDCADAHASMDELWPPNHKYVDITIMGVTDPDGYPLTITIDGITQDEPVDAFGDGNTSPDGTGVGTDTASVRAERQGGGNGRVYEISFTGVDDFEAACTGAVQVCVPHDQRPGHICIDDGQNYDSTATEAAPTVRPIKGKTSVKLSGTLIDTLNVLGIAPGALKPGSLKKGKARFPIPGGGIDVGVNPPAAEIFHVGGLSLTDASGTTVELFNFIIDTTDAPVLTGLVTANGDLVGRVPLSPMLLTLCFSQKKSQFLRKASKLVLPRFM
jgi:cysteine-rich repeat protein